MDFSNSFESPFSKQAAFKSMGSSLSLSFVLSQKQSEKISGYNSENLTTKFSCFSVLKMFISFVSDCIFELLKPSIAIFSNICSSLLSYAEDFKTLEERISDFGGGLRGGGKNEVRRVREKGGQEGRGSFTLSGGGVSFPCC